MNPTTVLIGAGALLLWYLNSHQTTLTTTGPGQSLAQNPPPQTPYTPAQSVTAQPSTVTVVPTPTSGAAPATSTSAPPVPPLPTSPPPHRGTNVPPPPPPATTSPNSLSAIFARLKAAAGAAGMTTGSPDDWNYVLAQVAPSVTPPDPTLVWPHYNRADARSVLTFTAEGYWAGVAPYLTANNGMSGLGALRGPGRRMALSGLSAYGGWGRS